MNKIACIYFEGNDSKVALFTKENDKLVLLKAESQDTTLAFAEKQTETVSKTGGGNGKGEEKLDYDILSDETTGFNRNYLQRLNSFFSGEEIHKHKFIPILGEPAIYFQKLNNENEIAEHNINAKGKIEATIGYVKLFDNTTLAVYPSGKSNYLQALDSLAKINNRRFLKIPSVKCAEISLTSHIIRNNKFDESENSLVLYIGKEYSKLIFLTGNKLHQISPTLSIGKNSFNAHNVIVSKILLEMEQSGFSKLDNIFVTGEDDSEDFISMISEAYPQTKVKNLKFDNVEVNEIDSFSTLSSLAIPIAVAEEYFSNQDTGINLLPNYIKEEQKPFQLGWQSYIILLLIFGSAFFLSFQIVSNKEKIKSLQTEITQIQLIQAQNQEIVNKIKSYQNKVTNVDQTRLVLNQLSNGTGVMSDAVKKVADFTSRNRNLWINGLKMGAARDIQVTGYTLNRPVARKLNDSYSQATLQNIIFEPMRDYRAFKFKIDAGNKIAANTGGTGNEKKN